MIVHESPEHRMGGEIYYREDRYSHDPELLEAYKCGKKDGWREAMEEQYGSDDYRERRDWREMPPMMRDRDYDYDGYDERRRRRANGRFY